jgi:hypothetical protein
MDIRKALLKEHSKRQTLKIAAYAGNDSKAFAKMMKLFLGNEYRITQRASWAVTWCVIKRPELIRPWIGKLIQNLNRKDVHDAVKRNSLRVLCDVDIPEKYQGEAVETCFRLMKNKDEPIAVKVFAMSVLGNICVQQPDLSNELLPVIEEMLPYGSAAIRSRAKKILKRLEKTGKGKENYYHYTG